MRESISIGFSLAILTIGIAVFLNFYRSRKIHSQTLQANCLLTRYPIVFLTGRRSLFYFLKFWNWIPQMLAEHGYEIFVLNLPWRKSVSRRVALEKFLRHCKKDKKEFHLLAEESSEEDLLWLSQLPNDLIKSCWIIRSKRLQPVLPSTKDLRPHSEKWREFELTPAPRSVSLEKLPLWLHNLINYPAKPLDPITLGVTGKEGTHHVRSEYLKLAILLAESDIR